MKNFFEQFACHNENTNHNTIGSSTMKNIKQKGSRRESSGRYYPLATWKKAASWLMVGLTITWIVPPNVIAQEIAEAQQKSRIEEAQRQQRTSVPRHLAIARQNEENSKKLLRTCRQIENNLITGKSVDSELKDLEEYQKGYERIREASLKQMEASRKRMVDQKVPKEVLERSDAFRTKMTERYNRMSALLKAVIDNKSKPEQLKTAVRELADYLSEVEKQPVKSTPKTPAKKSSSVLPRRGDVTKVSANLLESISHNGIMLASASPDATIGDWLNGLENQSVSGATTDADLAATAEAVIDDEIKALAKSLNNDPVKIYEYLRNNFVYEPYWGSIKGAKRTLIEKAGNDIDLASLLISLLRASNRHARYVCGTIELTVDEAAKWIGVDDPAQVAQVFVANGIPVETTSAGGKIASLKINHTWVRTYVDYFPYAGAVNEKPNTWVELDPSFKQNVFTASRKLETTIGINPEVLLTNVKAQTDIDDDGNYATKLPEPFILSEIFSYGEPIRSYLAANSLTTENVFRQRKVVEEKYGMLPVTDMYKVAGRGLYFSALPGALAAKATFAVKNNDGTTAFTYDIKLAELSDKTITIVYNPATDQDRELISANSETTDFPVYLVNVAPQMKIGETVVGTGAALGMGTNQILEVTVTVPGNEAEIVSTKLTAGSVNALVFDFQTMVAESLNREQTKLAAIADADAPVRDVALGQLLHGLGVSYFHQIDRFSQIAAGSLQVASTRKPSLLKISWDLNVAEQFGLPYTATVDRIKLDILRDIHVPVAIKAGDSLAENQYIYISALTGVVLEHNVLAQPFNSEAASAARVIQQANNQGVKIYTVTAANINTIFAADNPLVTLPQTAVNDIRNAVNANIEVTVPATPVTLKGVEYYAYAKRDIETSAAEFVLGSLGGGELVNDSLKASDLLLNGTTAAYKTVAKQLADWLAIAEDSTTNAGLAYLPAITAVRNWSTNRAELDPTTIPASILALSSPITKVYNQPAILNVVTGEKLISPNGDGIKDSFVLSAVVTKNAAWKWQITDPTGKVVVTEENTTPAVAVSFDQNIGDGVYSYKLTANLNGVEADPVSGTFKVDTKAPTVALTNPAASAVIAENKGITLKGTADDINFEKVTITAKAGDAAPVEVYSSNDITVEGIFQTIASTMFTNGPVVFTMTASDKAGNSSTLTRTVSIDNPIPDLTAPTATLVAKNGAVTVTAGDEVDAESGRLDIAVSAKDNVAVTRINLILDGKVIASGDAATLEHILNTMTVRDGAHTLQAEAYDAAGNKGQSAALNFNLTSPISNFRVTPEIAKTGTTQISITANLREAADWTISFSGAGSIPSISSQNASANVLGTITNPGDYPDGNYTVTLTSGSRTATLPLTLDMTVARPVAIIANVADGDIIQDGLFELKGTADDANASDPVYYTVSVTNAEGKTYNVTPKPVVEGQGHEGRVIDSSLGTLDFTMLRNGMYTLNLTVSSGGDAESAQVDFALNSELKIGQMSFSQQDLVIPVNGQPISVIRTYNSLNTGYTGDFGPGWTYSIKDMEVEMNEQRQNVDGLDGYFSMRTGGSRDITVTMPDGKRLSFMYHVEQGGGYFPTYRALWRPAPGVYATLEPTCSNEIVALPGGMQYWSASGPETPMDSFDIPGFILTMKDGTKYLLGRESTGQHFYLDDYAGQMYVETYGKTFLQQITDNNGNRIEFNDSGIQSYNASNEKTKSIVFDRDLEHDNRIVAIYAPSSLNADGDKAENSIPQFKYEYDDQGNLVKVYKLIDRSKPVDEQYAVTTYKYHTDTQHYPHYVTDIVDPSGNTPMRCEYDSDGRLIATIDANNHRTELKHDLSGRSETVTDRLGNPMTYIYDTKGQITTQIDAMNGITKFSYDAWGNKVSEINALNYETKYTYDSSGNQTSETDALNQTTLYNYTSTGKLTKVVDALGNSTIYSYDAKENKISEKNALGQVISWTYDQNGNMTSVTNTEGKIINSYEADENGNRVRVTDVFGLERRFSFSPNSVQTGTSHTWEKNGETKELVVTVNLNDADLPLKLTDPNGNSITQVYDINGLVKSKTDKFNQTEEMIYDAAHNLIQKSYSDGTCERKVYDAEGREVISTERGKQGDTLLGIRRVYSAMGWVVREERLKGVEVEITSNSSYLKSIGEIYSTTSYTYDALGQKLQVNENGRVTSYEYTPRGQVSAVVDSLGNCIEYVYDAVGNMVQMKDQENHITRYEYNALQQLTRVIYPDGSYLINKYNSLGLKTEVVEPDATSTRYTYDDAARIVKIEKDIAFTTEAAASTAVWEISYDEYGNKTSIKDPMGRITKFVYNSANQMLERTLPMGQKEYYEYDNTGRTISHTDFIGQKMSTKYDALGRMVKQELFAAGTTSPGYEIAFEYDNWGRPIEISSSDFSKAQSAQKKIIAYTYDSFGNIAKKLTPQGIINYEYDPQNNLKTRIWSEKDNIGGGNIGTDVRYTYDPLNRLKTVQVYQKNGVALGKPETTSYEYTKTGRRASMTLPNGVTTTYQYDDMKRLVSLNHADTTGTLAQFDYQYGTNNRRKTVHEILRLVDGQKVESQIEYQYDSLRRLVAEKRDGYCSFETKYSYDLCSNRTQKSYVSPEKIDTINYVYDENDRLISEQSSANGTTVYGYDLNGSLTTKTNEGKFNYQFAYDLQNHLSSAAISRKEGEKKDIDVTIIAEYAYDYFGNRVEKTQTVNGVESKQYFLLDEGNTGFAQVFEELGLPGSQPLRSYVIGDDVIGQVEADSMYYFLYDGHGSTRLLANDTRQIVDNFNYDAYGCMLGGNPNVTNKQAKTNLLYAGEQFDSGLQMEYLRARYYDQNTGRFNQLDPYEGSIDDPVSLHKYAYGHADPVNNIDPSGEFVEVLTLDLAVNMMVMFVGLYAVAQISRYNWANNTIGNWMTIADEYPTSRAGDIVMILLMSYAWLVSQSKVIPKAIPNTPHEDDSMPVFVESEDVIPEITRFDRQASVRHGVILHWNGSSSEMTKSNRKESLRDWPYPRPAGMSVEEYPFASTVEGGSFASTGLVPLEEQYIQGGLLNAFYRSTKGKAMAGFICVFLPPANATN